LSILVNKGTGVLVQGITGRQGSLHTQLMTEYGTKILAGVTPGGGGASVGGVPVYDSVQDAVNKSRVDASIIFVPAYATKEAAFEAIASGIRLLVIVTEGVPVRDTMEILAEAKRGGAVVIGPNTPGLITPSECKVGIMPNHIFCKGDIGIISRSGTLTYEISAELSRKGLGQSTCIGIGGDPCVGLDFVEILEIFREDDSTKAMVLIGEIGGNLEERAARYVEETDYPKPVVAYIVGRTAPQGKRMGHAGAIIYGKAGTAENKIREFRAAGVSVANRPSEISSILKGLV